jgi:hypothetical protein
MWTNIGCEMSFWAFYKEGSLAQNKTCLLLMIFWTIIKHDNYLQNENNVYLKWPAWMNWVWAFSDWLNK